MISNYPKTTKYVYNDRPYYVPERGYHALDNDFYDGFPNGRGFGFIRRVKVTGWIVEVSDSAGDGTGTPIQKNIYTVKEITGYDPEVASVDVAGEFTELYESNEFEILETELFSSQNHALAALTPGEFLNYSNNGDNLGSSIFRRIGAAWDEATSSFTDFVDFGGLDFRKANFGVLEDGVPFGATYYWSGALPPATAETEYVGGELGGTYAMIFDGCDMSGATLFTTHTSRANFKAGIFSYDINTTIWNDGFPVGRTLTGTVAGSSGGSTLTGTLTLATSELSIGDIIYIETMGDYTITDIDSAAGSACITVAEVFTATFTGKVIARRDDFVRYGRVTSGTGAGTSGDSTITGTSTAFTTQYTVGDTIYVVGQGLFTVAEINGDASMEVEETFTTTFTGEKLYQKS